MLKELIKKRLLTALITALGGALVTIFHEKLNLPLEAAQTLATQIVAVAATYILGQSASDIVAINKGTKLN